MPATPGAPNLRQRVKIKPKTSAANPRAHEPSGLPPLTYFFVITIVFCIILTILYIIFIKRGAGSPKPSPFPLALLVGQAPPVLPGAPGMKKSNLRMDYV